MHNLAKRKMAFTLFLIFSTIFAMWAIFNLHLARADFIDKPKQLDNRSAKSYIEEALQYEEQINQSIESTNYGAEEALTKEEEALIERDMLHGELFESIMKHMIMCRKRSDESFLLIKSCRTATPLGCEDRIYTFVGYILDAAEKYSLDPYLLAGMAYNESRFNPYAVGPTVGSRGIFQINPRGKYGRRSKFIKNAWYRKKCKRISGNCQENIVDMGAQHIKKSIKYCGSLERGLSQYNTGRCAIRKRYVRNTLRTVKSLRKGHKPIRWCDQPRRR